MLLSIVACGGFLYYGFSQVTGEGDVAVEVNRLFEEIAQGRSGEYYRTRGSAELKRATSEKEFVDFADTVRERLGILQSKTATGFNFRSQNLATYVEAAYACQFQRGKAAVRTRFKHENGQWLLLGFNVDSPELLKRTAREKCPSCGGLYDPGAKFCPHCGAKLGDDSAGDKRAGESAPKEERRREPEP